MQFRLTRRALEDLGLPIEGYAGRPATDYQDTHDIVRVFVERRKQDPKGQEWTNLPVTAAPACNLHYGRHRGLTWHDEDSDVVWLLGVGWHESDSADDAYAVLKARDESGTLMPSEQDYLDLEMSLEHAKSFVAEVSQQAPALVAQARQSPGEEVRGVIAGRLGVGVLVEVVVLAGEEESSRRSGSASRCHPSRGRASFPRNPIGSWPSLRPWSRWRSPSPIWISAAAFLGKAAQSRTKSLSAGVHSDAVFSRLSARTELQSLRPPSRRG